MEPEVKTLFVGNLPYEVTERDLELEFAPYGLHWIRLVPDRGIAFVDVDAARIQEAVDEKHDSELWGRRLTVNESKPRENEPSTRPGDQWRDGRDSGRPRMNSNRPPFPDRQGETGRPDGPRRFEHPGRPKSPERPGGGDRPGFPRRRD